MSTAGLSERRNSNPKRPKEKKHANSKLVLVRGESLPLFAHQSMSPSRQGLVPKEIKEHPQWSMHFKEVSAVGITVNNELPEVESGDENL